MQYKQAARILIEIIQTPNLPIKIGLAAVRLFGRDALPLPKLGPYRRRSIEQALWRLASGTSLVAEVRWMALRKLLSLNRAAANQSMEAS